MKRILITGGAGFLGSHLCDRFIKEGYHVIAMDNLITGDLRNIEHLFKLEHFEFYHHDVSKFVDARLGRHKPQMLKQSILLHLLLWPSLGNYVCPMNRLSRSESVFSNNQLGLLGMQNEELYDSIFLYL